MSDAFSRFPTNPQVHYDNETACVPWDVPDTRFAPWGRRFAAIFADWFIPYGLMLNWPSSDTTALVMWMAMIANAVVLQGLTGASVGKTLMGLQVAWVPTDRRENAWDYRLPGMARCGLRLVGHFFDLMFFAGFFKLIANEHSKTWGDSLASTVVVWDDRIDLRGKR